ncbi:MAG: PAS domain-containing protein, partial [Rhodospirillales bacterium]
MIEEQDERFWAETPIATLGPILNTIGVAVFVIDVLPDDGFKISFINRYYERTFGVSAAETTGRLVEDALPTETVDGVVANYKRCIASRQ